MKALKRTGRDSNRELFNPFSFAGQKRDSKWRRTVASPKATLSRFYCPNPGNTNLNSEGGWISDWFDLLSLQDLLDMNPSILCMQHFFPFWNNLVQTCGDRRSVVCNTSFFWAKVSVWVPGPSQVIACLTAAWTSAMRVPKLNGSSIEPLISVTLPSNLAF